MNISYDVHTSNTPIEATAKQIDATIVGDRAADGARTKRDVSSIIMREMAIGAANQNTKNNEASKIVVDPVCRHGPMAMQMVQIAARQHNLLVRDRKSCRLKDLAASSSS